MFARIGGHPALDLVNTVEWRLSPERLVDTLLDYADVVRWAVQSGLVTAEDAAELGRQAELAPLEASAEADRVRALREAVYAALFEAADAEDVVREYREAIAEGRLSVLEASSVWDLPLDLALPRRCIALEAFDLLTRADLARIAQCQDAECGWVFLDTSPRRDRRWCVSAECGNRNRVRDYYARKRANGNGMGKLRERRESGGPA